MHILDCKTNSVDKRREGTQKFGRDSDGRDVEGINWREKFGVVDLIKIYCIHA